MRSLTIQEFARKMGAGKPLAPRPARPPKAVPVVPAWALDVQAPDGPVRLTVAAHTRGEARALILAEVNRRYGLGLTRLPPGKSPRRVPS